MTSDVRSESTKRSGRALLVVAAVAAAGAASLATYAFWPSADPAAAVLDITTMTAATAPDTIPPQTTAPIETPIETPTTTASSDGRIGTAGSTAPPAPTSTTEPPPAPPVVPLGITIGDIDLWGPVRPVGLDENGALEVPDETEVGWYDLGSSPGRAGSTVLAAPFYNLGSLEPGAHIDVHLEDDSTRTYEVVERTMYDKDKLPRNRIWRRTGDETLVLITCGGSFNEEINRYRQNIVVSAVPVA